ncbi:MAG: hypothetical protein IPN34_17640 [Planctomycetes bacterium]|nr:hypothetical protein [Planctomycetota bacterium]
MTRIDFLSARPHRALAEAVKHPINTVYIGRVETEAHPAGRPCFAPVPLPGATTLIEAKPVQSLLLTDEYGQKKEHRISYADGAIRGADLVDNCSKERVAILLNPASPAFPGEPGVVVRTGMKSAALTALSELLAKGLALPAEFARVLDAEAERTAKLLTLVQAAKAKFTDRSKGH